ncbi:hypothetical protein DENSPDRAFT_886588 [Dentipellis sp. KUC8613]|nr:hypothetical protein DENSPDRAFT_886588 [Dentipellis sp. KUC8613]
MPSQCPFALVAPHRALFVHHGVVCASLRHLCAALRHLIVLLRRLRRTAPSSRTVGSSCAPCHRLHPRLAFLTPRTTVFMPYASVLGPTWTVWRPVPPSGAPPRHLRAAPRGLGVVWHVHSRAARSSWPMEPCRAPPAVFALRACNLSMRAHSRFEPARCCLAFARACAALSCARSLRCPCPTRPRAPATRARGTAPPSRNLAPSHSVACPLRLLSKPLHRRRTPSRAAVRAATPSYRCHASLCCRHASRTTRISITRPRGVVLSLVASCHSRPSSRCRHTRTRCRLAPQWCGLTPLRVLARHRRPSLGVSRPAIAVPRAVGPSGALRLCLHSLALPPCARTQSS